MLSEPGGGTLGSGARTAVTMVMTKQAITPAKAVQKTGPVHFMCHNIPTGAAIFRH